MNRFGFFAVFGTLFSLTASSGLCEPVEQNFRDIPVASIPSAVTSRHITSMTWAPDGSNRLFLTIKDGPIRVIQNGALLPNNFYTLSPYIQSYETGVLSLAFDPNFAANHYVYVFYTDSMTTQKIVRITDSNNDSVGDTVVDIKTGLPCGGANHDGGAVVIGPDHNGNGNFIYWAIGNLGGGSGEGADLSSLASKIGRMNMDGTAPNDNPFYNSADGIGPTDFIWARGLRNPFTMALQPSTKKLWANVVGDYYEQIFIANRGDYMGDRFNENRQPNTIPGTSITSVPPIIKYRTNAVDTWNVASVFRSSDIATFNTTEPHYFKRGEKITVAGVSNTSFNGDYYVKEIVDADTFTVTQSGSDSNATGGSVRTQNMGGCVTGGAFYDAGAFPAEYQGNFFFGDHNAGAIFRAVLDSSNNVTKIDTFATLVGNVTDVSVGADGALYYANLGGSVGKIVYDSNVQSIVLSTTSVDFVEGGSAGFSVSLAKPPTSNVDVYVRFAWGDSELAIVTPAHLIFTPSNYATPQTVTITAAEDSDAVRDNGYIALSAPGMADRNVAVTVADNDSQNLVVSASTLSMNEGSTASFNVRLSTAPASNVTVNVYGGGGDPDITVTSGPTLTFTPSNYSVDQQVSINAAEDTDTSADQTIITLYVPDLPVRTVTVSVVDNDAQSPNIISPANTVAVLGSPYQYDVNATGLPAPTYSLTTAPAGMMINSATGLISWNPTTTGTFNVIVSAGNGVAPNAVQSYQIIVTTDSSPSCSITLPKDGSTVSGAVSDFFGDAFDDVGTVKAEFYIDGTLAYTDVNSNEHYHIYGGHGLWNTTLLPNGAHTLRMVVFDTANKTGACQVSITILNGVVVPGAPQQVEISR